jgi:Protein of unknown function (DUF4197)
MTPRIALVLALFLLFPAARAATVSELRDGEVAKALREALEVGVGNAVTKLGQEDGFLGNETVRIPLPESVQKVESSMRKFGMGKQADQLIETMNRAAEQAVPEAKKLLVNAARGLTIDDAKRILTGPDDAATQYFRAHSEEQIAKRFLPIVARETKRLKLADYYNKFANRGVALGLVREEDANLDEYVTRKALDGLFVTVAEEEKAIRANPLESGKRLIKKVFGAVQPE